MISLKTRLLAARALRICLLTMLVFACSNSYVLSQGQEAESANTSIGAVAAWIVCLLGAATCSGLNVAYFVIPLRDLQVMVKDGSKAAQRILAHRNNANFTLAAILFTNVGFGVGVSQVSDQVFGGIWAFVIPVFGLTVIGEILPQSVFAIHAIRVCSFLSPFVWFMKIVTFPLSYPLSVIIDKCFGQEVLKNLKEKHLLALLDIEEETLKAQPAESKPDKEHLGVLEIRGMKNFAIADDVLAINEGRLIDPRTEIRLPFINGDPQFPELTADPNNEFVAQLFAADFSWFIIIDEATEEPSHVLDADGFVRDLFFREQEGDFVPQLHIYPVAIYRGPETYLGEVLQGFHIIANDEQDHVIDVDVALLWLPDQHRIITGADCFGRLMRGIARREHRRVRREELKRKHQRSEIE